MSRRARTTIIAGVALLVMIAMLIVLLCLPEPETDGDSDATDTPAMEALIDKATDDDTSPVAQITLTHNGETMTVKPNAEEIFCVEGLEDLPVDTSAVESLLDEVTTITPESLITETAADVTAFGLGEKATSVTVTYTDETVYTFELGSDLVDGSGVYFRESDSQTVYAMSSTFAETMREPAMSYVGKKLTVAPTLRENDSGTAQLMKVEVSGPNRDPLTVRYMRDTDDSLLTMVSSYLIEEPYLVSGNNDVLSAWQTGFNNLTADAAVIAHPTAAQWAEAGLDTPAVTARLTLGVVTAQTDEQGNKLDTTEVYNSTTYTLYFGGKDEDGNFYVRLEGTDVLYAIDPTSVAFATATLDDVIYETLFHHNIVTVDKIKIDAAGESHEFDLTHTDDEENDLLVAIDGKDYDDPENFRNYYSWIIGQERYKSVDEKEADDFLAGSPAPVLTITFRLSDGTEDTATVYEYGASRSLVVKGDHRYLMKSTSTDTLLTQLKNLLAGETVTDPF